MISNNIYDQLERLSTLLRADTRQAGIAFGLQPVQMEILHYLSICNRFSDTPMAVTEYLGQTKGTVSQTIKLLESKELLTKTQDSKDKRVAHLALSTKGKRLLAQLIPTDMFRVACGNLGNQKQQEVSSAIQILLTSFLTSSEMKSFGICHSCRHNRKDEGGYFCSLLKQPLEIEETNLICWEHTALPD